MLKDNDTYSISVIDERTSFGISNIDDTLEFMRKRVGNYDFENVLTNLQVLRDREKAIHK